MSMRMSRPGATTSIGGSTTGSRLWLSGLKGHVGRRIRLGPHALVTAEERQEKNISDDAHRTELDLPEAAQTTTWWARLAPADMPDTNVRAKSADSASHGSALALPPSSAYCRSQERNVAPLSMAVGGGAGAPARGSTGRSSATEHRQQELGTGTPAAGVEPGLVVGTNAVADSVKVDKHRELFNFFADGQRLPVPIHTNLEAACRVVHDLFSITERRGRLA
ncbi:hypothetical protein PR202_gb26392 [Eleusine coracana subsp. coracana]|uniref:Uncharacterized protein n=1 Tax=Eleusine coracana subsp. coracana TaxID=191504 RepID=A0AAV5FS18_ELECO|nr:hypothetical protein PR202_gb26392 [Eleusine coracana subsp. coracana]